MEIMKKKPNVWIHEMMTNNKSAVDMSPQEEARMRLGRLLYSEAPFRASLPVTQGHKGSIRF